MKQVLFNRGSANIENVPAQMVDENSLKVETAYSFISPGTEMAGLERSGRSLIKRAAEKPENIKKLYDRVLSKGLSSTVGEVKTKIETGTASGYSLSGRVIEAGRNISGFRSGDHVACAGSGIATHSEVVVVPKNLIVHVPEGCSLKAASSVAIGSIALQGVRRSSAAIGETIAVVGLGLIGQITAQVLSAAGCHVVGVDLYQSRVTLALKNGIEHGFADSGKSVIKAINRITNGLGVDTTIICAASKSDAIVQQAMEITRKKGKVVLVGDVGLGLQRKPFYEKEIDFLISCSYGPGRYDKKYEIDGVDYPRAYVRWTENENMSEYLKLIAKDRLNIDSLIDKTYPIDSAKSAYNALQSADEKPLGVVLEYSQNNKDGAITQKLASKIEVSPVLKNGKIGVAVIGTGSFACTVHLPNIQRLNDLFSIQALVGRTGGRVNAVAKRFPPAYVSTNFVDILNDPEIDAVFICTRHNLHAYMAAEALKAGKAVFLEKPMALTEKELDALVAVHEKVNHVPVFMVGFNRRFSPAAIQAKKILESCNIPKVIIYRVRANPTAPDHWIQSEEGGGRIIGEACHMIDLFGYFTGSKVISIDVESISPEASDLNASDNFAATFKYENGSICSLIYTTLGSNKTKKEHIEIFCNKQTLVIDDYKKITDIDRTKPLWVSKTADKGHMEETLAFVKALKGEIPPPIPFHELVETAKHTFRINEMLHGS